MPRLVGGALPYRWNRSGSLALVVLNCQMQRLNGIPGTTPLRFGQAFEQTRQIWHVESQSLLNGLSWQFLTENRERCDKSRTPCYPVFGIRDATCADADEKGQFDGVRIVGDMPRTRGAVDMPDVAWAHELTDRSTTVLVHVSSGHRAQELDDIGNDVCGIVDVLLCRYISKRETYRRLRFLQVTADRRQHVRRQRFLGVARRTARCDDPSLVHGKEQWLVVDPLDADIEVLWHTLLHVAVQEDSVDACRKLVIHHGPQRRQAFELSRQPFLAQLRRLAEPDDTRNVVG